MLMQSKRPIAYLSKGINNRNLGLSIYEKEAVGLGDGGGKVEALIRGTPFYYKDRSSIP